MSEPPLLAVEDLAKHYPIREGLLRRQVGAVKAVDGISFTVAEGETVGLIGESGCGKSTAATSLLRLEEPTGGAVRFRGHDITDYDGGELRAFRRRASMVFQNPNDSFDPKMTIGESVAEPLRVQGVDDAAVRRSVVDDLLERCGLPVSVGERYPHELSDGMKQRAALARALVVNPDLLVADEPVSALDVSIQAEIISLLGDLKRDLGLSMLVISHDMGVVRELCDRVCVMYLGEIVERGPSERLFTDPDHPYTAALAGAVAQPDPRRAGEREPLGGEIPDAASPPPGCSFHERCPEVIPPEALDVDQATYRAVMDFRVALRGGDIDRDALREAGAEAEAVRGDGDAPTGPDGDPADARLRRGVHGRYGIPADLGDERAARALETALDDVVAGDLEGARERLRETFSGVCEHENPALRRRPTGRDVACHLHHDPAGAD